MAIGDILNGVINFVTNNWILIAMVVIIIILFGMYVKKKPKFKPISREDTERKKFIDREKLNKTDLKYLYRGNRLYGQIRTLSAHLIPADKDQKEEKRLINIVFKPCVLGIKWLTDPFEKDVALVVSAENSDFSYAKSSFTIDESAIMNKFDGVRYDVTDKKEALKYIRDEQVSVTDWENHSSVMFVEAQKMSTFGDSSNANAMALKEKELQVELAKKRGKQSSI